jgi:Fe-S cluster biosynthesis and repair protein YggX
MSNPVLKSLVESMIVNYLEESYEEDLMESIFEEVSEETWEAIEEAILNELSPKTLTSYRKKAKRQAEKAWNTMKTQQRVSARAGSSAMQQRPGSPARDEYDKKSDEAWKKVRAAEKIHDKRGDGYHLAGKKLGIK